MPTQYRAPFIRRNDPHRFELPGRDYLHPAVREALDTYLRIHGEMQSYGQRAVAEAQRAVVAAKSADRKVLADAIVSGTSGPSRGLTRTQKAEAELAEVEARKDAYRQALGTAYRTMQAAVVEHAQEWASQVEADHADAITRLTESATAFQQAAQDAVATGSILEMLRKQPERLIVGSYPPERALTEAHAPLTEAVAAVKAHELASAVVVEPEDDAADEDDDDADFAV
jgi:hypothetical protein